MSEERIVSNISELTYEELLAELEARQAQVPQLRKDISLHSIHQTGLAYAEARMRHEDDESDFAAAVMVELFGPGIWDWWEAQEK